MTRILPALAIILFVNCTQAAQDECSMCHDAPPVEESHPAINEVSPGACFTCHAPIGDDALFISLHETHPNLGMTCESCHEDADAGMLEPQLKDLLGK